MAKTKKEEIIQRAKKPYRRGDPLTVAQLIQLLQHCNPEAEIVMEGCDCISPCRAIETGGKSVYLARWPRGTDFLTPVEDV